MTPHSPAGLQDFHYSGGQYVFICIPEISLFEWHPFSISSSPDQPLVTLHVRALGSWTRALHKLALKKLARANEGGECTASTVTTTTSSAMIEGPYGSVACDIHGARHDMFMLIRYVCMCVCVWGGVSSSGQPTSEPRQFPSTLWGYT